MSARTNSSTSAVEDVLLLLGRIAFAAIFLPSGIRKLNNFAGFAEGLEPRGLPFGLPLPFPDLMAVLAVATEILAPLMVLVGLATRWGALWLAAFVVMATLTAHRFWDFEEAAAYAAQSSSFYRNMAYIGAMFFLFSAGAGRLSVDHWWRSRAS